MLSCRQIYELITEYDDGGLSTSDRRGFESHVVICPPCRGFVSQMRVARRRVGDASAPALPPELEDSIVDAFRTWKQQG